MNPEAIGELLAQLTMSLAKKLRPAYLRCRTSDNPLTVLKGTFGARSR